MTALDPSWIISPQLWQALRAFFSFVDLCLTSKSKTGNLGFACTGNCRFLGLIALQNPGDKRSVRLITKGAIESLRPAKPQPFRASSKLLRVSLLTPKRLNYFYVCVLTNVTRLLYGLDRMYSDRINLALSFSLRNGVNRHVKCEWGFYASYGCLTAASPC